MLVADAPLPDGECWFRPIVNTGHITRDKTIHGSSFNFSAADPGKPWAIELSGCVVSLHQDAAEIISRGETRAELAQRGFIARQQKVPSKIVFCGFACAKSERLRTNLGTIMTDVFYTPMVSNTAHSDFVVVNGNDDTEVRSWLVRRLRVLGPNDVNILVSTCGPIVTLPVPTASSTAG